MKINERKKILKTKLSTKTEGFGLATSLLTFPDFYTFLTCLHFSDLLINYKDVPIHAFHSKFEIVQ